MNKDYNIACEIKLLDNIINRKVISDAKNLNIPFYLSPIQLKILHFLLINRNQNIYQKDIEKIISARRSTTSGILSTMEKNNLIARVDSSTDARMNQIILTQYSNKISKQMMKQKEKFETKIKEGISQEELEIFFKVTEKIKNNIMNMES